MSRTPSSQPAFSSSSVTVGWIEPKLVWLPISCLAMAAMTSRRPLVSSERAFSPMTKKVPVTPSSVMIRASQPGMSSMRSDSGTDVVLGVEGHDQAGLAGRRRPEGG